MTEQSARVDRLSVRHRESGREIVASVSFEAGPGEILGVVGETGAGKTLTMQAMLGLLPRGLVASGSLQLRDRAEVSFEDMSTLRGLAGRDITMILQNPAAMLDPLIKVGKQLVEGPRRLKLLSKERALERALELLNELGFKDAEAILNLYPHQLSGGMAQRVAIAMMMMPRPTVLIADEPTSALDAHIRVEVLSLLSSVARAENSAVVLVSHDLGLIGKFADRILVLYAGHIMEEGPTEAVLSRPLHPYTKALLDCSPSLAAKSRQPLQVIAGIPPYPGEWPTGCVFEPRCPLADERGRRERPALRRMDNRMVACHRAFELDGVSAAPLPEVARG